MRARGMRDPGLTVEEAERDGALGVLKRFFAVFIERELSNAAAFRVDKDLPSRRKQGFLFVEKDGGKKAG